MEILAGIFVSMFVFIAMPFMYFGLNLRKWPSWLLVYTDWQQVFFAGEYGLILRMRLFLGCYSLLLYSPAVQ